MRRVNLPLVRKVNLRSELDLAVEEMERAQARLALLEREHEAMLEKVGASRAVGPRAGAAERGSWAGLGGPVVEDGWG